MGMGSWRWGVLLVCWPFAAQAADANLRVVTLPAPPVLAAGQAAPEVATQSRIWLRAPRARTAWYELRLAGDWQGASPPLLSIRGNMRARMTVYLPPDYRPRRDSVFDAKLDPEFSHHAVVYRLPPHLRADQPVYVAL